MLENIFSAISKTFASLGWTLAALFVAVFVRVAMLSKKRQSWKSIWKSRMMPRDLLSTLLWSLLAIGYVFAFHLGVTYVRVERQHEPAVRYSLGGSTNVFSYYPVPYDRWVPITEFRDVTLEWTREREATVEGIVSFPTIGVSGRCRLRLIDVPSGSTVAVTDWISRPDPSPLSERADVRFRMAVPRGEGLMVYRLEITSDRPNGDMVASA